jgi:hypothetical protein
MGSTITVQGGSAGESIKKKTRQTFATFCNSPYALLCFSARSAAKINICNTLISIKLRGYDFNQP